MRWLLAALLAAFAPLAASAQDTSVTVVYSSSAPSYQGVGDVSSGAAFYGGLRAYNAAYATGSNNAVNVRRASDNTTSNIVILANGKLDVATANSFAGTDATASCTFATTTATCTGASSTPHVGSTIAGAGVVEPCYVTSVGTFTGGAGTLTVSGNNGLSAPCGTIGSAVSVTLTYGLYVAEVYDQSGTGNNVLQATAGDQPQLFTNCLNSLPCMSFIGSKTQYLKSSGNLLPGGNASFTWQLVLERTGAFTTLAFAGSTAPDGLGAYSTANTGVLGVSSNVTLAMSDSVEHIFGAANTGSSSVNFALDGTITNAGMTNAATNNTIAMGSAYTGTLQYWTGYIMESVLYLSNKSTTVQGNLCHNAYVYWGTPTSC